MTAFLRAFSDGNARVTSRPAQLFLGEDSVTVETDAALADRAEARLLSFDRRCSYHLDRLLRAGEENNEQIAFLYLRFLAQNKRPVSSMLTEKVVFDAMELIKRVGLEVHRLHGFIRFMQLESGAAYAPFSPDHDVCDLLVPHFRARFPATVFVLHDVKRKKAAVYDGKRSFVLPLDNAEVLLSADEAAWQALWKRYYNAVNIPSRERKKQMRGYMPTRYWQFMPEKQD